MDSIFSTVPRASGIPIASQTDGVRIAIGDLIAISRAGAGVRGAVLETVSWTPSLLLGGAAVGMTFSIQLGTAIRFGPLMYFDFRLALTALGSSTGAATINLPGTATGSGCIFVRTNVAATGVIGEWNATATAMTLENAIGAAGLNNTHFGNTSSLIGNGFVRVG